MKFCLDNCEVVCSDEIIEELAARLKSKTKASNRWVNSLCRAMREMLVMADTSELPEAVRDPKDNHVIAAAHGESCAFIITGDADLLALGKYEETAIVTPREFANLLQFKEINL